VGLNYRTPTKSEGVQTPGLLKPTTVASMGERTSSRFPTLRVGGGVKIVSALARWREAKRNGRSKNERALKSLSP
jgi:hypothetical protein